MRKILVAALAALMMIIVSAPVLADMPDWYPDNPSSFVDFNDPDAPRLVDNADIFDDDDEETILSLIGEIQQDYNRDMVVYTDVTTYGMDEMYYSADFYQFNGYGFGENHDGSILFICMDPDNRCWWGAGTGSSQSFFTETTVNALDDRLYPYMVDGEYGMGVINYLQDLHELYGTGSVPGMEDDDYSYTPRKTIADYDWLIIGGLIVSAVLGLSIAGSAKKAMNSVHAAANADRYAIPGSFNMRRSNDIFLYMTVIRTEKPKNNGGGGGGSRFSGGYSSSGGMSFSGGGRKF